MHILNYTVNIIVTSHSYILFHLLSTFHASLCTNPMCCAKRQHKTSYDFVPVTSMVFNRKIEHNEYDMQTKIDQRYICIYRYIYLYLYQGLKNNFQIRKHSFHIFQMTKYSLLKCVWWCYFKESITEQSNINRHKLKIRN